MAIKEDMASILHEDGAIKICRQISAEVTGRRFSGRLGGGEVDEAKPTGRQQ